MPQDNSGSSAFQGGQGSSLVPLANSKNNMYGMNSEAIPLLDLSEEQNGIYGVKSKRKKTKR